MTTWTQATEDGVQQQNKRAIEQARRERNSALTDVEIWTEYSQHLEELLIEVGSHLDAACVLIDRMLKAANGEEVEHADKLLSPDGGAVRQQLLAEAKKQSLAGMQQAHQERLQENPNAASKKAALNKSYHPQTGRTATLWKKLTEMRTARNGAPTPADAIKMKELLLEIGPELIASNNLVLRLLAEGNGHPVPEKLMPAGNHDARAIYLENQAKESKQGMIAATMDEVAGLVSPSVSESTVARQKMKIARTGARG